MEHDFYWLFHYGEGFYDGYYLSSEKDKKKALKEACRKFHVAKDMIEIIPIQVDGNVAEWEED